MTRRFRDWLSPRDDDDDAALDALLAEAWESDVAAVAKVLDLDAGLAALMATRDRQEPPAPTTGQSSALGGVRQEIDALLARVTAEINAGGGPARSSITPNLYAARQFLIQLRTGLAKRSLAKADALQLTGSVEHALEEALRTLRRLPSAPGGAAAQEEAEALAGLLSGIKQQLPALARKIERLFDEASDPGPLVPAPSR